MRNLKRFEGRGIVYAKLLNERRVVRAKGGISVDMQFCPDLYISQLLSVSSLVINIMQISVVEFDV